VRSFCSVIEHLAHCTISRKILVGLYADYIFVGWLAVRKINLSETIRKPPLAEAQTAVVKQKIRSVERRYLSYWRKSEKTACFTMQNVTEIGQSSAELWPKNDFKTVDVCHLEFGQLLYLVTWLPSRLQIFYCVSYFIKIGYFFVVATSRFSRWRSPPSSVLRILMSSF